ncbi:MAG: hypothetical protein WA988_17265 [Candidatus Nanopelagicales bacterium]
MTRQRKGRLSRQQLKAQSTKARAALATRIAPQTNPQLPLLLDLFDADWYVTTYAVELGDTYSSPFEHYCAVGQTLGLSPGPDFAEASYRRTYYDVAVAIAHGRVRSGHEHFVRFGRGEGRHASGVLPPEPADTREPTTDAAPAIVINNSAQEQSRLRRTAVRFARRLPPRQKALLADLDALLHRASGADEFSLHNADVSKPIAFNELIELSNSRTPFAYRIDTTAATPRVNIVVPRLHPQLVFGGYIALFELIRRLQQRGWPVRILITEDVKCNPATLADSFAGHMAEPIVRSSEIVNLARRTTTVPISSADSFIGFSVWSAFHAQTLSAAVGRPFIQFVQEYEPVFHAHDSYHALATAAFDQPHFAIFNSEFLRRHFEHQRLGVYSGGRSIGEESSVVFEHALAVAQPPTEEDLRRPGTKRLLVYARPEQHAARNLFAVVLLGLRKAVADGVFGPEWTIDGVGSLTTTAEIDLGNGHTLNLRPRLALGSYAESLRKYDVGLSLQYAPHPGVVHFEMAASGILTVTNTYLNRTAADLTAISPNLVPVRPTPDAIAAGLADAVKRASDIGARIAGATQPWVTSWDRSFNESVLTRIESQFQPDQHN